MHRLKLPKNKLTRLAINVAFIVAWFLCSLKIWVWIDFWSHSRSTPNIETYSPSITSRSILFSPSRELNSGMGGRPLRSNETVRPDDLGPIMDRVGLDRPVGPGTDRWGRPNGTVYFDRRHENSDRWNRRRIKFPLLSDLWHLRTPAIGNFHPTISILFLVFVPIGFGTRYIWWGGPKLQKNVFSNKRILERLKSKPAIRSSKEN